MSSYYAVARGRTIGVFRTWALCEESVKGFKGAKYHKFPTEEQAWVYVRSNEGVTDVKTASKNAANRSQISTSSSSLKATSVLPKPKIAKQTSPEYQASTNTMESSNHMFDFAAFAQRLTNLENMYQEKIRTLEERVEALEAAKALADHGEDFDSDVQEVEVVHDSTTICPAPSDENMTCENPPAANIAEAATSTNTSTNTSSLRRRLLNSALNPTPVGTSRSYSTRCMKRSGEEVNSSDVPPAKMPVSTQIFSVPFKTDSEGYVEVYTDGACSNNGRHRPKAGVGVWFNDGHPLNISEPVRGRATNNMAEIQAATWAVQKAASAGVQKLSILTDSGFMIDCMTQWVRNWKTKGWSTASGHPVKNKQELIELDKACSTLGVSVKWTHVPGHRGVYGNERADQLARSGAERYKAVGIPTAL